MKSIGTFIILLGLTFSVYAQQKNRHISADFVAAFGKSQGTGSISGWNYWYTGKKKRLELGAGIRISTYFGSKKDFVTAPAGLSRGSSVPFLVVLSSQETGNWDTLTVQQARLGSVNAAVSALYNFSDKFSAGFDIDLIGFSFGKKSAAVFTAEGNTYSTSARPSSFNLLLTGDLDYGSLNSSFYIAYRLNEQFSLQAVYQFYFAEYTTPTEIQQLPEPNDRFRNKANLLGVGIRYHFKK